MIEEQTVLIKLVFHPTPLHLLCQEIWFSELSCSVSSHSSPPFFLPFPLLPLHEPGTADREIKIPFAETPEPSNVLHFKPGLNN